MQFILKFIERKVSETTSNLFLKFHFQTEFALFFHVVSANHTCIKNRLY